MSPLTADLDQAQPGIDETWGPDTALVLEMLRDNDEQGVTIRAIRESGVEAPAQLVYMLQLAGYTIDRLHLPDGASAYRLATRSDGHAPCLR